MKLITRKAEPNDIGVHSLIVALVLSRKELSPQEKIKNLLNIITFKIKETCIQKSELQYIFHLVYNWIEVTTMLKLKESLI